MARVCAAARAGDASVSAGPLGFAKFNISFIGTGTATFSDNIEFNTLKAEDLIQMEWTTNRFIGHHWFLGNFNIDLNSKKKSTGRVENVETLGNRIQGLNTNEFFFKFTFPRFNALTIFNDQPIINSSIVFDIPPTEESVYKLSEESKSLIASLSNQETIGIKFNYCDISLFPERNIDTEILDVKKTDGKTYSISVKYTNLTNVRATCAYFLVLHDKDLITHDDYGFKKVNSGKSFIVNYSVSHRSENVKVELPIFGGIYLPKHLRGSMQKTVELQF